jgi:hypothetical protein
VYVGEERCVRHVGLSTMVTKPFTVMLYDLTSVIVDIHHCLVQQEAE